jgi:hypothetical protein
MNYETDSRHQILFGEEIIRHISAAYPEFTERDNLIKNIFIVTKIASITQRDDADRKITSYREAYDKWEFLEIIDKKTSQKIALFRFQTGVSQNSPAVSVFIGWESTSYDPFNICNLKISTDDQIELMYKSGVEKIKDIGGLGHIAVEKIFREFGLDLNIPLLRLKNNGG